MPNLAARIESWAVLGAALVAGCAVVKPVVPPTDLPEIPPRLRCWATSSRRNCPTARRLLPPPPAAGSAALAADEDAYRSTRKLRDTPRWALAAKDADLTFPEGRRDVLVRARHAHLGGSHAAPEHAAAPRAQRREPRERQAEGALQAPAALMVHGDTSCTPRDQLKDDSYPSGHASIGWAWALALAEIAPDRANAILARGLAYGQSRVVCGVHWKSDIEAGRVVGASTVSRLHADPVFAAQLAAARKEVQPHGRPAPGPRSIATPRRRPCALDR